MSQGRPLSLQTLALAVQVGAGLGFIGAVVHLFGLALGVNSETIIWLFTFSDIVSTAAPIMAVAVAILLVAMPIANLSLHTLGTRVTRALPENLAPYAHWYGKVVLGAILLLGFVITYQAGGWPFGLLAMVIIATASALSHFVIKFSTNLPPVLRTVAIVSFMLLIYAFFFGFIKGYMGIRSTARLVSVQTNTTFFAAKYAIPLERGVVLFHDFGFTLVPWNEVKTLMRVERRQDVLLLTGSE